MYAESIRNEEGSNYAKAYTEIYGINMQIVCTSNEFLTVLH
jgi:hypothetical protein